MVLGFPLEDYVANQYVRSGIVLLAAFLILRIFIFILERFVVRATKNTKTDIDDIFIERTSKPITFLVLLLGLWLAIHEIALPTAIEDNIWKIYFSFVVLGIAYILYVVIDVMLVRAMKKIVGKTKSDIDDSLVSLIHSVLRVVAIILAGLYILEVWGIEIGPFLAGLGIGGIAVAFAMQESLANIFGGLSIILDKSVKKGDLIYLDAETKGEVVQVGFRATRIKTFDNEILIVPNSIMANSKIQNVAQPEPKSRVVVPFGVAYGSDIEKVKKLILKEIPKIANVIDDPEPAVRFLEMADSSLNFKAYFHVDTYQNRFAAIDEANQRIYEALNKAGISIPFPQMDVHMKKE